MTTAPGEAHHPRGPGSRRADPLTIKLARFSPPVRHAVREQLAWLNMVKLIARPVRQPDADEAIPVLLVPGFGSGDYTMVELKRYLRGQGFAAYRSRIFNVGCTAATLDQLEALVEELASRHNSKVALVGHSRGGTLAKVLAVRRPDLVNNVIGLASPNLDPFAAAPWLLKAVNLLVALNRRGLHTLLSEDCVSGVCRGDLAAGLALDLPGETAYTVVFSRTDGIVDWKACLDPTAQLIEVRTSHIGMPASRQVQRIVATQLAHRVSVNQPRAVPGAHPERS